MNLENLMNRKKSNLLNIYFTAGFPELNSLPEILMALEEAGVDMVEIGVPYSDPISDGPTIQKSNAIAIENGITMGKIFNQLSISSFNIPVILMAYFNSVYQFGIENFCQRCQKCNIDSVIVPDLPIDHYEREYSKKFQHYGIEPVFLITPETEIERLEYIDRKSRRFIYAVSSSSTTGQKKHIQGAQSYLERINSLNLQSPVLVGFNIKSSADYKFVCSYVNGGIIGSAFINHISNASNLRSSVLQFVSSIKENVLV